jgi:hypothetical protein
MRKNSQNPVCRAVKGDYLIELAREWYRTDTI